MHVPSRRSQQSHSESCTGKNAAVHATSNMATHNRGHPILFGRGLKNCVATDSRRFRRGPATQLSLRREGTSRAQNSRCPKKAQKNWHTDIQTLRLHKSGG